MPASCAVFIGDAIINRLSIFHSVNSVAANDDENNHSAGCPVYRDSLMRQLPPSKANAAHSRPALIREVILPTPPYRPASPAWRRFSHRALPSIASKLTSASFTVRRPVLSATIFIIHNLFGADPASRHTLRSGSTTRLFTEISLAASASVGESHYVIFLSNRAIERCRYCRRSRAISSLSIIGFAYAAKQI